MFTLPNRIWYLQSEYKSRGLALDMEDYLENNLVASNVIDSNRYPVLYTCHRIWNLHRVRK